MVNDYGFALIAIKAFLVAFKSCPFPCAMEIGNIPME